MRAQVQQQRHEKGIAKGNKRQISLTIAPDLLRKVDEVAKRTGRALRRCESWLEVAPVVRHLVS